MASVAYCEMLVLQSGCKENISPRGMRNGIHMGADLVTMDGRGWIKASHAVDGERISIKHTYRNGTVNSSLTQSF